jgi:ABC-2 type transport system ATP-binding protein
MQPLQDTVVEVRDLVKQYPGIRAVDGISFKVHRAEIFGMVGPNGAGKTTTIECIEGLRKPDGGSISVLGLDPRKDKYPLRERIGVQFQSASLPDRIKVWEALDLFASFYERSIPWEPLLEHLGLGDKRGAYFGKLSGGQKQRVFIALALVNKPELIFLDEITTGLDPQSRRVMWDLVLELRKHGTTVFLTTHFMEEAERLCDRVAIIDYGKIVALDSPSNLTNSLGAENRVVFEVDQRISPGIFDAVAGVKRVERIGERMVVYGEKKGLVAGIATTLEEKGVRFGNLRSEQPTLEDVFLALTGREMRE